MAVTFYPGDYRKNYDLLRKGVCQFNFVSCGRKAGATTAASYVLLDSPRACTRNQWRTAFFSATDDQLLDASVNIMRMIQSGVASGSGLATNRRLSMITGASVLLRSFSESEFDVTEPLDLLVIDNAHLIPGFYDMWTKQILPMVEAWGTQVWVFGRARGASNGFGRLCRAGVVKGTFRHVRLPTTLKEVLPVRADLSDLEWAQEVEGVILDEVIEMNEGQVIIGPDETFLQWCERLAEDGLMVDGHAFRLDNRPTMRWIYEQIPSTPEEAYKKQLVLMKCAQVGFTIMEMLAMVYLALKFPPCKIGMYLPGKDLAALKSSERFMPIVRTVPDAYRIMIDDPSGPRRGGEGNVLIRNMGGSRFHFLWTSGRTTTESVPLDVVSFDEVQEMSIADMEKTGERLSASRIRYTLMGSTANWPDRDIHFFYKKGTRHRFWTACPSCGTHQVLDDHFPSCIKFRELEVDGVVASDYRYVCHQCDGVIVDSQVGQWRADNPEAPFQSIHYPQFLSPTITPREMIEAYFNADDMKNFYNRKLGKPYLDPSQVPVDLEMLNDCAKIGMSLGVVWESRGSGYFMGIDQMGAFNVVLIAKRLPSGHMAVVHAEEIYNDDPFARCDELMKQFAISVCVVETLPNYNDAKRFAGRFPGRVFLASYSDLKDDMLRWGDSVPSKMDRKTSEEDRDRYTVTLDQYKCMQVAMKRITNRVCVFPDPSALVQEIREKGLMSLKPILSECVFLHFTRTALVADMDDEVRKFRRRVVKVGIDPHFSYAYMLLNVAWARSHGTTMFLNPQSVDNGPSEVVDRVAKTMPGLPQGVLNMLDIPESSCGRCMSFNEGMCMERNFLVRDRDPGCDMFVEASPDYLSG